MSASPHTPLTVLVRLRHNPRDEASFRELVERYGTSIDQWCRRRGLSEHDAQDATQELFIRLLKGLHTYDFGQPFRNWLYACVRNVVGDYLRARRRGPLEAIDALDPPADDRLEDVLTRVYEQELIEVASQRVRLRVDRATWEVWRMTAPPGILGGEGIGMVEAGRRLGVPSHQVHDARRRVRRMLEEEANRLDSDG